MSRTDDRDPDPLADQLEHEAEELERRGEKLEDEIEQARQDWRRKRDDPSVPGANPEHGASAD